MQQKKNVIQNESNYKFKIFMKLTLAKSPAVYLTTLSYNVRPSKEQPERNFISKYSETSLILLNAEKRKIYEVPITG